MSKSTAAIRQAFLDFFHSKGHQVVESSSLLPDNDSTLLFTNAGMNQFKDVFLGLDNSSYRRVTTSQRCVRAGGKHNDLENVGYTVRHHTFFEMLGNFSFGDYFKHDTILFAWELLTHQAWFNVPKEKLWVTVYSTDHEAYNIWANEVGIPTERIIRIGDNQGKAYASDNFWNMGDTGPCGPCSEIFYDHGDHIAGGPPGSLEEGDRYIEIWNLVFMQFNRQTDGTLLPLPNPSVDTGMGLERIAAVLQHVHSNYDIDLFKKIISAISRVIGNRNLENKSLRVIADHIRASVFLISDGVIPSNEGRGYVLRRIIRRAIRHGNMLNDNHAFLYKLVAPLIDVMDNAQSQLKQKERMVEKVLRDEEEQFSRTLIRGLTLLDDKLTRLTGNTLDGETAFRLHDTYGFPLDLTTEICREHNINVDETAFKHAMEWQRKRARTSNDFSTDYKNKLRIKETTSFLGYENLEYQGKVTALFHHGQQVELIREGEETVVILNQTPFYAESGGQVGDQGELQSNSGIFQVTDTQKYGQSFGHLGQLKHGELKIGQQINSKVNRERRERICLNHSATHLLHTTLRQELGMHILQKGSLVNDQYLRFDFSHPGSITPEKIHQVEKFVNKEIRHNLVIYTHIMTLKDAKDKGAIALFGEKYNEKVRVLSIGDFSIELCAGTHANRTGDIGLFRIISESGIAAGVRRIEAITGEVALTSLHQDSCLISYLSKLVKADSKTLLKKVRALQEHSRQLEKEIQTLKIGQATQESAALSHHVREINGVKLIIKKLHNVDPKILRTTVDILKNQFKSSIIILSSVSEDKVNLIVSVTRNLIHQVKADEIIGYLAEKIGGKGGGRSDLAQAGGGDITVLPMALASMDSILSEKLLTELNISK
ncbi:alanine--tRNA ligase [Candidatus Steffania adelgidicola]|uniref:alanine--tRNA ligase n=1 Tax=Candidatus Steffania adelgidicola TaxID=1076626 RepID=UPI001D0122B8|nr:alanine--tRNA ligase [Candidatus Steffania adelgidicola]UDG79627.1 Alanine--tRNA ligase [Candidatus Steffania adelgidicola]